MIRNNGGNNLTIAANGAFSFPTAIVSGSAYAVTVLTQPSGPTQTCAVANGSGTIGNANVSNVAITCVTSAFTVGGTLSGLTGTGLVIQNNGGNNVALSTNGAFVFNSSIVSGGAYNVTVLTQPSNPVQTCSVTSGSGTVTNANVTSIAVACSSNTAVVAIGTGGSFTCALTVAGGVQCWGSNNFGELGDGSGQDRWTPVNVVGLTSGVSSISIASEGSNTGSSCAVTLVGGLKCWGTVTNGNVASGIYSPADVTGLTSGVASVSRGNLHTCVVTTAGGVKCWGGNGNGQLGIGTKTGASNPVDVVGLTSGVASVSAGGYHTCAVTTAGAVKCWGSNSFGELGNGTTTESWVPVNVSGLSSGVASISAGMFATCAVTTGGAANCWGNNTGNGTIFGPSASLTPVTVSGLSGGTASVSVGSADTCAVTTAGAAKCWGSGGGLLGAGTDTSDHWTPVTPTGLTSGVVRISPSGVDVAQGSEHTCAAMVTGGVKCWGYNQLGQLGTGTTISSPIPVDVQGLGANLSPNSHISGVVTNNKGTPYAGIYVYACPTIPAACGAAVTAADGSYAASVPNGNFIVQFGLTSNGLTPTGYYSIGGFTPTANNATIVNVAGHDVTGISVQMP